MIVIAKLRKPTNAQINYPLHFARLMLAQGIYFVILSARKIDVVWTSHSDQLLYATLIALLRCDANACLAGRCPRPDMLALCDTGRL